MTSEKIQLKSKLPRVGTTIFTVMSQLANEHQAINLSQGFPDFECSPVLVALVNKYMKKGFNQYAPMAGVQQLRESIAEKTKYLYNYFVDPQTEITVTSGATQAIYTAITAVVNEGDEVLIFEPAYDCYTPAIELNGGKAVYAQLKAPDYNIDWQQVKKLVNSKTKLIIINTPHNPTGTVLSKTDMEQLEKLVSGTGILIISDEVYEHILFDGILHQSVLLYPKLAERSFVISSFGKTFHTTGWKMGYCLAPENLMMEFRKVHQFVVFAANTPVQYALAEYMSNKQHFLELPEFYQHKRDQFLHLIKGCRFEYKASSGTYFQLLRYSSITKEKDTDYAIRLVKEFKLASVPVSVFYHNPIDELVLRFCFAKKEATLKKAAQIIKSI